MANQSLYTYHNYKTKTKVVATNLSIENILNFDMFIYNVSWVNYDSRVK